MASNTSSLPSDGGFLPTSTLDPVIHGRILHKTSSSKPRRTSKATSLINSSAKYTALHLPDGSYKAIPDQQKEDARRRDKDDVESPYPIVGISLVLTP